MSANREADLEGEIELLKQALIEEQVKVVALEAEVARLRAAMLKASQLISAY